jgi:hypothetical protein
MQGILKHVGRPSPVRKVLCMFSSQIVLRPNQTFEPYSRQLSNDTIRLQITTKQTVDVDQKNQPVRFEHLPNGVACALYAKLVASLDSS